MKRKLIIFFVTICIVLFLVNILPKIWFKWCLNKNTNAPQSAVQEEKSSRLCLIFALDGVPYDVMAELTDQGYFKGFYKPGRLISTYPSLTRPAFSKILIGGKPFGYERLYFDTKANKMDGNRLAKKIFSTSAQYPDYHPKLHFLGFPGYIAYVFPDQFTQTAIDTFKNKLLNFKGKEFIAYMGFSDAIAHVQGKDAQIEFLKKISFLLDEIRNELGILLDVVIFSDHGNNFVDNIRVDLAGELKKAGLNDTDHLESINDFILPRNGFVSTAAIYSHPDTAPVIARTLSKIEGVDFSTYLSGQSIMVHGSNGIASIQHQSNTFKYTPLEGDPLQLIPVLEQIKQNSQSDDHSNSRGFISSNDLWQATKQHIYPDPLHRIWQGHHDLVQHPATLIVSFQDGFAFGPAIFDQHIIAGRKSTHGALLNTHSYGFYTTDFQPVDDYNRPNTIASLLKNSALAKQSGKKKWPFKAMEWLKKGYPK